ncbi:Nuclear cap-binding protein subunit 1 [Thoreauomyces humboldtii]|nr:Nuclear cap-binding protein subunit 1 [Thoreauomyces humboldtii]
MSYGGNQGYRNRGGPNGRRHADPEPPQKSPEERKQEELNAILFTLADQSQDFKAAVDIAASKLSSEISTNPEPVLKAFRSCASQVPHKGPIYGTLAGVLNAGNPEFGALLLTTMHEALQSALAVHDFRTVKILVRYLAELFNANTLAGAQLVQLYDTLLSVLDEPGVTVERSDAYVYAVLASVPWAGEQLHARLPDDLVRLMRRVETYMQTRRANFDTSDISLAMEALAVYRNVPSGWPYEQLDRLETLWRQIIDLQANDSWKARILFRLEDYQDLLASQTQHELQPIKITQGDTDVKFSYQPVFRLFDDSLQTPENAIIRLPSTSGISRFILEDLIYDIVRIFSHNHKEGCRLLFGLDAFLDPFYLEDGGFQLLASAVETLFGELLRLPRSGERSVYYATLLMDMIKADVQSVPKMIGRAVRTLFSRLDGPVDLGGGMDIEAVRRLTEWFAVHLSNFGHVWNWAAWEPVLSVEHDSTSFVFIRETLERSIRLAYWERVQGTIPETFATYEAIFPKIAPKPNFKFEGEGDGIDPEIFKLVTELRKSLANKTPAPEVSKILKRIAERPDTTPMEVEGSGFVATDKDRLARDAFVHCVMLQGSKSFSHVLNVVERYISLLREYNATDDAKAHTVRIIAEFWKYNTQFLEIILDKLMNYRVLDPKSIVSWVLDPVVLEKNHTRFYLWAILRTTLGKVNFKVEQLTLKLTAAKDRADQMVIDGTTDEDEIKSLEENRTTALREQKETFLLVFQAFVDVITEKHAALRAQGVDPTTTVWNRWLMGSMREVARGFPTEVKMYKFTLDSIIFHDQVDAGILQMWREIKAVYAIHTDTLV